MKDGFSRKDYGDLKSMGLDAQINGMLFAPGTAHT